MIELTQRLLHLSEGGPGDFKTACREAADMIIGLNGEIERLRAEPMLSDFLDYVTEVYGSGHPAHIAASMFVDRINTRPLEQGAAK